MIYFQFLIIALFVSIKSIAGDAYWGNYSRIDEDTGCYQVAFKEFVRSDNKSIKLVSLSHFAETSFYEKINSTISGKTVIYELMNGDLESIKKVSSLDEKLNDLAAKLGNNYLSVHKICQVLSYKDALYAQKYGLILQDKGVDLCKAKALIHADIINQEELSNDLEQAEKFVQDSEAFKNANFISPAKQLVAEDIIKDSENEEELVQNLLRYLEHSLQQRLNEVPSLRQYLEKSREDDKTMPEKRPDFHQKRVLDRNQIILNRLQEVLSESGVSDEVIVCYGLGHMPMIEEFLIKNMFTLKGVEWVPVMGLK